MACKYSLLNLFIRTLILSAALFSERAFAFHTYHLRASIDTYPYYHFSSAPFNVIKTNSMDQINNRNYNKQFYNPNGFSLELERLYLGNIYGVFGYSYTYGRAKSDISTTMGVTRTLKLENFCNNEFFTGLKYYFPTSTKNSSTYIGFNIGVAINSKIDTAVDKLNNINVKFGGGKLSAPYYKKHARPMVSLNVGIAYPLFNKFYGFIDIGIKVSGHLTGSGLGSPVSTPIDPHVLAVRVGNTGNVISFPLRIGILY